MQESVQASTPGEMQESVQASTPGEIQESVQACSTTLHFTRKADTAQPTFLQNHR